MNFAEGLFRCGTAGDAGIVAYHAFRDDDSTVRGILPFTEVLRVHVGPEARLFAL